MATCQLILFFFLSLLFVNNSACFPQINMPNPSQLPNPESMPKKLSTIGPDEELESDTDVPTTERPANASTTTDTPPRMQIVKINFPRVETALYLALWVGVALFAKTGFYAIPKLPALVPESCFLIMVGILIGFALSAAQLTIISPLNSTIFFFCMLPPIIFDAGYFMPNRLFFDHLGTILLFAVVGTIFNTFTIGFGLWLCGLTGIYGFQVPILEIFIFSALISAVDPVAVLAVFEELHVDAVLYIIVFGESLLNDAVTVVLYNMFDSYVSLGVENIGTVDILVGFASFMIVAIGGASIGIIWGFLTGLTTRFTYRVRVVEPLFIFVLSYLAYINAETFQMSGILSIMFCGLTMKNYVESNVSAESQITITKTLKMLSNCSETIIFIFLGINTVQFDYHIWNTGFVMLTILFCCIFRVLGVILLTEVANHFRLHQLNYIEKFVMSYGGLRGAIAYALVLSINPLRIINQPMFVTTTISVVYFTAFFQGITIKPLVNILKVKRSLVHEKTMNERIHEKEIDYLMAGIQDILGRVGTLKYRDKFKQVNNKHIRPLLIRTNTGHEPKIIETYGKLTMTDALKIASRGDFLTLLNNVDSSHFQASNNCRIRNDCITSSE